MAQKLRLLQFLLATEQIRICVIDHFIQTFKRLGVQCIVRKMECNVKNQLPNEMIYV
jgi:hypothetical protein